MKYLILVCMLASIFSIDVSPLTAQWVQTSGPESAVVDCLAGYSSVIFAGTRYGGIFISTDKGASWNPLNSGLQNRNVVVTALEVDSTSLFIGTSNGAFRATDSGGEWVLNEAGLSGKGISGAVEVGTYLFVTTSSGVFRSADGDTNWTAADGGLPNNPMVSIAMSPDSSRELAVGTQTQGVYVSSDTGRSWSSASNGLASLNVNAVAFARDSSDTATSLYAATELGVCKSTDNGKTWTVRNANNSGTLSLGIYENASGTKSIIAGAYLEDEGPFLSTDDGNSWTSLKDEFPPNNDGLSVYVDRDSPGYVFLGLGGAGVYRSTDYGATWNAANNGLIGASISSIAVADSGAGNATILASSYYVNYASHDGGSTWNAMSATWYPTPLWNHIYSFAVSNGRVFACGDFAGLPSNVYTTTDFGHDWTPLLSAPNATTLAVAQDSAADVFAGTNGSGVFKSSDNGSSWTSVGLQSQDILCLAAGNTSTGGTIILAGTAAGVYRSTDAGASWLAIGLTNSATSFAMARGGLYIGSEDGAFLSRDGGKTWTDEDSGLASRDVRSLVAVGSNVFAATDSGIFLSRTARNGWQQVNEGLLSRSVNCLDMDSTYLYIGTAGDGVWKRSLTQLGIITRLPRLLRPEMNSVQIVDPVSFAWDSIPGADSYELQIAYDSTFGRIQDAIFSNGPTSLDVYPFLQDTAYYWRVRGYNPNDTGGWSDVWHFRTGMITPVEQGSLKPTSFSLFQNYPNPFNPTTVITYDIAKRSHVTLIVYDVLGRKVETLVNDEKSPGRYQAIFNGSDLPSGVYFFRIEAGNYVSTKKLMLMK